MKYVGRAELVAAKIVDAFKTEFAESTGAYLCSQKGRCAVPGVELGKSTALYSVRDAGCT